MTDEDTNDDENIPHCGTTETIVCEAERPKEESEDPGIRISSGNTNSENSNDGESKLSRYNRIIYNPGEIKASNNHLAYLPVEGIGLGGSYSTQIQIRIIKRGGKYYAIVSAVGSTPASGQGLVEFNGTANLFDGHLNIGSSNLIMDLGPTITSSDLNWSSVGFTKMMQLPSHGTGDISISLDISYFYQSAEGGAKPVVIWKFGTDRIQVGTKLGNLVDGITY